MPQAIKPTPLSKPKRGLLAAASVVENSALRFGRGLTWHPERVANPALGTTAFSVRELDCTVSSISVEDGPVNEESYPFTLVVYDRCSAFDDADLSDKRDRLGRARRLLEATRSWLIAEEFWTGTAQVAAFGSTAPTWLGKTTGFESVSGGGNVATNVALLDNVIADRLTNGQGMIHMTPKLQADAVAAQVLRREGSLWLSPNDNIVVADGGYVGNTEADAASVNWMIATGPVEVHLSEVRLPDEDATVEFFDNDVNDIIVWAQQDVIVNFDPQILRAGVEIT